MYSARAGVTGDWAVGAYSLRHCKKAWAQQRKRNTWNTPWALLNSSIQLLSGRTQSQRMGVEDLWESSRHSLGGLRSNQEYPRDPGMGSVVL